MRFENPYPTILDCFTQHFSQDHTVGWLQILVIVSFLKQACASISVSKLCNFHLPYLVTFLNKLFCFDNFCEYIILFCFVPEDLGFPVLAFFFNCFFFVLRTLIFLTLFLGYSYTYNVWKFTLKSFHKVVCKVNIFHLQP